MPRPIKMRNISYIPQNARFFPENKSSESVNLDMVEVEALRLKDLLNLEQEEAADNLGISRGTFQRILYCARKKLAEAIVYGKEIIISGGEYSINNSSPTPNRRRFRGGR